MVTETEILILFLQHSVFEVHEDGHVHLAQLGQLPVRLPPLGLNNLPLDEWGGAMRIWPGDIHDDGVVSIGPALQDLRFTSLNLLLRMGWFCAF